ncbi:MAG: SIMPL domain-containing protein [bacterium]
MNTISSASSNRGSASVAALVLGVCLIASAAIWSLMFYRAKALDNSLSVTGSVRQRITSDTVKWTSGFSRRTTMAGLAGANAEMKADYAAVVAFFQRHGIAESSLTVSPLNVEQVWGGPEGGPTEYTLRQTVQLLSTDVLGVTQIAKDSGALLAEGVFFASQSVEYSYSKLPELRVQMLAGAIEDARNRAGTIAQSSGGKLGSLKSASVGVTQVLQPSSMEISDYGAYDTSTIEKEVVATVRAAFTIK